MQVSKANFIQIYNKTRPQVMMIKNIMSGFSKTGLNPFNPLMAICQLPLIPMSPPRPTIPFEFQTPQNLHQLDFAIKKTLELRQDTAEDHSSDLRIVESKIAKAATVAMAKEEILRRELKELRAHHIETGANRPRKKKKVLGKEPLTVREVRDIIEAERRGGRRQRKRPTTRRTRARKQSTTPETSDLSSDESLESEESDISTLIVCQ